MTDTDRNDTPPAVADAGTPAPSGDGGRDVGPGWPPATRHQRPGDRRPTPVDDRPGYRTSAVRLGLLAAFFIGLGLRFGWSVLVVIAGIVVMIFLHELGHYLTARWSGMKVTEFFIGFGPKIWSFRRGETEYGLKVLPAGAYVRIIGMNNLDEVDPADELRTYRQQSFPRRLLVVSAGSIMHFVQGFVLIVVLLGVVGYPGGSLLPGDDERPESWDVTAVVEDSAAERAGLRSGDEILVIDGRPASAHDDFRTFIAGHDVGDELVLEVARDGEVREVPVELGARPASSEGGEPGGPFLGVGTVPGLDDSPIGVGTALARAPGELASFAGETVAAMGRLFSPDGLSDYAANVRSATDDGSGDEPTTSDRDEGNRPISIIGIVNLGQHFIDSGAAPFLVFFVMINVFIGILNMAPLPPLDGGHAVVAIYERLRSRRGTRYHADIAKVLPLAYAVIMGLVLLGVSAIYLDIVDPINL